jgi:signal transduction histidine kinase/CheY-like chemotaxis protein/HPt (histidine-containing phosphotransfer) domain-containing protein
MAPGDMSMDFKAIIRRDFKQLLFVFLAFFLMVLVSYFFTSGIVERQVSSNAEEVFHVAEAAIRSAVQEAEIVLLNTSFSIEDKLNNHQPDVIEEVRRYIKELILRLNSSEANTAGLMNIRAYIQEEYIDSRGWVPPPDYHPGGERWFVDAWRVQGDIARTDPYTDSKNGEMIFSFSRRLRGTGGEDYGVLSLELDIYPIAEYIEKLQSTQGGYGMLLDQDLIFIVHPESVNLNKFLFELSPGHRKIAGELMAGKTEISAARAINTNGARVVLSFRRIFTGWYIGIGMPVSSYYHTAYIMAAVLSLLGLAFMSILSFLLIRLSMAKIHSDEENRSKSSFLARMSHEIRTPMNSILGMTELLLRKNFSPEVNDYLSVISQSGHTLLAIINDILDFSKITSGRFKIEPKIYRFSSLVNDTISVIRMRLMEKPLDFLVTVDSSIPAQLIGDDLRIRQILINLLNNAIKYTPKGYIALDIRRGKVTDKKLELIFSVRDSGIGIKAEDLSRIFSDFTRLDMSRNYHIEGTGLGLAITYTLCQAMEGSIKVESEYGKGSTFTTIISQSFEEDKKLAQVQNPEKKRILFFDDRPLVFESIKASFLDLGLVPARIQTFQEFLAELENGKYDYAFVSSRYAMDCIHVLGKGNSPTQLVILVELGDMTFFREVKSIMLPVYSLPIANTLNNVVEHEIKELNRRFGFTAPSARILIVDDISSNLRVAKELMAPYKAEVHTCLSGVEALELVQKNRYDIVFMDHMMPGMDGLEATAAIRSLGSDNEYYRELPIIALTANAVSGQQELFLQKGLNDFIAKPIEVKQLNAVLERWIPPNKKIIAVPEKHEESAETMDLWIPGIDIVMGMKNVNGSLAVYLDILEEFCRNVEDIMFQIRQAEKEKDNKLYADSMHALKGVSRSIGALELGNFAEVMERAAKNEDTGTIKQRTVDLLRDVMILTSNIHAAALRQTDSEPRKEMDLALLHLDILKKAIIALDIDSVNKLLVGYLSMSLSSDIKAKVDLIEQHILMFEYEKAVGIIDQILGKNA